MNTYEIAILYDPDLEVDLSNAEARVKKIIEDSEGKVTNVENWGKRKLAYNIKTNEHAIYVFYSAEIEPKNVAKIESTLNITSEVIRYLITKPDMRAKAKADKLKSVKAEQQKTKEADSKEEDND